MCIRDRILAGTVCINSGTTVLNSVDTADGWTAQVKSDGLNNNQRTDVQFRQSATGDHIEFRYEPGKLEIR